MKIKPTSKKLHEFEEERAKEILAYVFPHKYAGAELQESPDIYVPDSCIGVEVTDSTKQSIHEIISRASNIVGKTSEELSERDIWSIQNYNIKVLKHQNGQLMALTSFWGGEHDILSAYLKKYEKLNSEHFKRYKENNLFIFAWMIDDEDMDDEILIILQHDPKSSYKFDHIYIFSEKVLCCVDCNNANTEKYPVPPKVMEKISKTSFEKVFGYSKKST